MPGPLSIGVWLTVLALGLPAGATAPVRVGEPSPDAIIQIPEATGVSPALGCEEARRIAREAMPPPPTRAPRAESTVETLVAPAEVPVTEPVVDPHGRTMVLPAEVSALPGWDPEHLPLQPLEGSPQVLAEIAAVLERAHTRGRVRLSFLGASHTGGDIFTGQLRRQLQARYGDLGHGFVHPAALYTGYRGHDINLCSSEGWRSDWVGRVGGRGDSWHGMAGASVSSSEPAAFGWLETTHSNVRGRRVSRYELFTLGQPGGGTLLVSVDDAAARSISTNTDQHRLLHHRIEVSDGAHRLMLQPAGDGEVRVLGVSAEREGPGVLVDSMGIRGQQARSIMGWDPILLQQGLAALAPDLLVLAYGTNEANDPSYSLEAYREDLELVLVHLRTLAPDSACLLIGPSDRAAVREEGGYWLYPRTQQVAAVQRELAEAAGCAFWDWQQATGGAGSMVAWRLQSPPLAGWDFIHFTMKGYELSADRFLAALDQVHRQAGRSSEQQ